MWINGKRRLRNVYAHTREECEEKLKEQKAEGELKDRAKEGKKGKKVTM